MPFKTLLVPVDGSEHADLACKQAVALARLSGGTVHLLHCYENIPNLIGGEARAKLVKEYEAKSEKLLDKYRHRIQKAGVPCLEHILHGDPGIVIVEAAAKFGCDIIVMGTRGLGGLENLILGSVSYRVLQAAVVPVLLTR